MIRIPIIHRFRRQSTSQRQPSSERVSAEDVHSASQLLASSSVLVAGAGPNIGGAVMAEAARHGAAVYGTDIDVMALAALRERLESFPVTFETFVSDISSTDDVDKLVHELDERGVHIDVLVNNVGIELEKKITTDEAVDAVFRRVFESNIFGPMRLTSAIVERMMKRGHGGSVIFVSSIHQWTVSGDASYSASKSAIGMLVRELALRWGKHGIRVNAVAPGWVAEDASGQPLRHDRTPLHQTSIPPAMIGRAVVHLASGYFSRYTTGTTVTVDAGLSLRNYLRL